MKKPAFYWITAPAFLIWMDNFGIGIMWMLVAILMSFGGNVRAAEFNLQAELMNAQGTLEDFGCKATRVQQIEPYQSALQDTSANGAKTVITSGAIFRITCLDEPMPPTNGGIIEPDPEMKTVFLMDLGTDEDRFFNGGDNTRNTTGQGVYANQRFMKEANKSLIYTLPVVPATYLVRLHFYESWHGVWYRGGRVFDVIIDGITLATQVDVWLERGENTPYIMEFLIDAGDTLTIELLRRVQNPMMAAIELQSADPGAGIVEPEKPPQPVEKPVSIEWNHPIKREDNSPLPVEEISGYVVEICPTDQPPEKCREIGVGSVQSAQATLQQGQYIARVKTVDTDGVMGRYSEGVGFAVP